MTLTDLQQWVADQRGGDRSNDAIVLTYINAGLLDLAGRWNWPWLLTANAFTLTGGTDTEAIDPQTFTAGYSVFLTDTGEPLMPTTASAAALNYPVDGTPRAVYFLAGNAVFRPKPATNTDITILYYGLPTALAIATDVPPFAEPFHLGLAEYALWKMWEEVEDYSKGDIHRRQYLGYVDRMFAAYREPFGPFRTVLGETITPAAPVQVWGV